MLLWRVQFHSQAQTPLHLIQEGRVPFELRTTPHWPDGNSDASVGSMLVNWCALRCRLREIEMCLVSSFCVYLSFLATWMKPTFREICVCLLTSAKSVSNMNYRLLLFLLQSSNKQLHGIPKTHVEQNGMQQDVLEPVHICLLEGLAKSIKHLARSRLSRVSSGKHSNGIRSNEIKSLHT